MSCCKTYDPCLDGKLNQIGSYASAARQSAQESQASATSAAASAAAAAASAEIAGIYLGPFAVAPTTDNQGNPLQEGMLYYNTVSNVLFAWNGSAWASADFNEFTNFTATGTTFARNLVTREADVINVKDFGAVGDGVADDTAAIQAALSAGVSSGSAIFFPNGTYITGRLTINSNQKLYGESKATTVLKLKNSANTDILYGANSDSLWGTNTAAGVNNVTIRDFTLDGNRANNTQGSCIAIYGSLLNFYDINIKDAPEYGIRTEWYQFGEAIFGMEGHFERITVDKSGKHGIWFRGPHDSVFINVIVIDASQLADNTYDAILIEQYGGGRWIACHTWSRALTANVQRYGISIQSGANEFVNCHFEGSKTANVLIQTPRQQFHGCLFYAAKGGLNIHLRKSENKINGILLGKVAGTPACVGIKMGDNPLDFVANNIIDVIANSQDGGTIDFTNSQGGNSITVRGDQPSGISYIGTPRPSDVCNFQTSGASGSIIRTELSFTGISAAGTDQATATQLNYAYIQNITNVALNTGVRLPTTIVGSSLHVNNNGANPLNVYPAVGNQIGLLGANNPLVIPSGKGALFLSPALNQWSAILSA